MLMIYGQCHLYLSWLQVELSICFLTVENPKIFFRLELACEYTPGWDQAPEGAETLSYCCIRVKDNGMGISEEVQKTMFDPFFTTKEVGKGTGMGLAMAYGTVSNHSGWIHVESEVGKGTEFFIYLPLADAVVPRPSSQTCLNMTF